VSDFILFMAGSPIMHDAVIAEVKSRLSVHNVLVIDRVPEPTQPDAEILKLICDWKPSHSGKRQQPFYMGLRKFNRKQKGTK